MTRESVAAAILAGGRARCVGGTVKSTLALDGARILVALGPRDYEPLCAVYSSHCPEPIRRRLENGALRATVLPEGVQVEEIGPEMLAAYDPDGLLFVNVNTPHDYERARDLIESMPQRRADRITDKQSPS